LRRPYGTIAIRYVLLILSLFCVCSVAAETLIGRVVSVADGDTITVLDDTNRQNRIKEHLAGLIFGWPVTVDWHKHDRYGQIVGVCLVEGRDVGLDQLKTGLAWHYKKYAHEQADDERREYEKAETKARNEKEGCGGTRIQFRRGNGERRRKEAAEPAGRMRSTSSRSTPKTTLPRAICSVARARGSTRP